MAALDAFRNGCRERTRDTRARRIGLSRPKLRKGSSFPSFLRPRRTAGTALTAAIREAYVHGISTRPVDDLVMAMGAAGVSKSQVGRLCEAIDERVNACLGRPIEGERPYLWIDATFLKTRKAGRVVSVAAVIAGGVNASTDGRREIVGVATGASEAKPFWKAFPRSLADRGRRGVRLVIADDHKGLRAAATRVCHASHQRCRVPWMRDALARVAAKQRAVAAVTDARPADLDRPDPRLDPPLRRVAVADHRPAAACVGELGMGGEERFRLGRDGLLQPSSCALAPHDQQRLVRDRSARARQRNNVSLRHDASSMVTSSITEHTPPPALSTKSGHSPLE